MNRPYWLRAMFAAGLCLGAGQAAASCARPQVRPEGAGVTSWYGGAHQDRQTANGERFDKEQLTAAHPSLPFGTLLRVTNLGNGRKVTVRINDRGPGYGRLIDLSEQAAKILGMAACGLAVVQLDVERRDVEQLSIGSLASLP
jgi:rare lipoprotein A